MGALLVLLAFGAAFAVRAADPDALWRIIHDRCVPNQQAKGEPAPCALVDIVAGEDKGVAILKDINGVAQHLAIPTWRVAGIESPTIFDPALANYWGEAWAARSFVNARLGHDLPRDAIGLAINAATRRSQNQMHIHIDCVAPAVRDALIGFGPSLGAEWRVLPFALQGRRYWARRLDSADLRDVAPFALLADGIAGARADMAHQTLVAVGAVFGSESPGFILLADRADPDGGGHGEDLLDAHCAVAAPPP